MSSATVTEGSKWNVQAAERMLERERITQPKMWKKQ